MPPSGTQLQGPTVCRRPLALTMHHPRQAFEWLIQELLEMPNAGRAMFLNFVTARRRLPAGGLRSLPPLVGATAAGGGGAGGGGSGGGGRITVDASSGAAPLMKGNTCNYRLHMPRGYTSREELRHYLYRSMEWSSGMHD